MIAIITCAHRSIYQSAASTKVHLDILEEKQIVAMSWEDSPSANAVLQPTLTILSLGFSCNLSVNSICFRLDVDLNLQGDREQGNFMESICADVFNLWANVFAPALSKLRVLSGSAYGVKFKVYKRAHGL